MLGCSNCTCTSVGLPNFGKTSLEFDGSQCNTLGLLNFLGTNSWFWWIEFRPCRVAKFLRIFFAIWWTSAILGLRFPWILVVACSVGFFPRMMTYYPHRVSYFPWSWLIIGLWLVFLTPFLLMPFASSGDCDSNNLFPTFIHFVVRLWCLAYKHRVVSSSISIDIIIHVPSFMCNFDYRLNTKCESFYIKHDKMNCIHVHMQHWYVHVHYDLNAWFHIVFARLNTSMLSWLQCVDESTCVENGDVLTHAF